LIILTQKSIKKCCYGAIGWPQRTPKGLDPQNQDFDQFLMKNIKKSSKNDEKVTF